jgi:type I restriction enzyme M protein
MLDTATKKRIDDCRDILVGKLPDPKAQIEQITIALIYKFMDDMDKEAIELGGKAKFFTDYKIPNPEDPDDRKKDIIVPFAQYAWDNLRSAKITAVEKLRLYSEAIQGIDKNPNIPQLFRDIFKNAFLPYRDPETLNLFLKTISEFEYTHSEKLGDAFEYLLSIMGSQGDAGQFRTPRHIIDFLVAIVDPQKNETILDPACGTAGFLISAFKHIKEKNKKGLTPDERKKMIRNFVGYDISPDMVRLSLVNLYLHGFSDPHIWEYDTLSSEERWDETFDVVLANPPFMSPKGGIRPHKKFSISSNRSEVLFVDYIAEHLNPTGRAGIIVPEGVIFQSGTAYKDLRKMLVENYLYAVVSLPAGVFNPYSGVKTSMLLMDKQLAKHKDEILFVKIENDGYNLGAQRNEVKGSQLSEAVELIQRFKNDELSENNIAHPVAKKEIAKNGDYNLSGERYIVNSDISKSSYELVKVDDICDLVRGSSPRPQGDPLYYGGTVPRLMISDITRDGMYTIPKTDFLTEEGAKKSRPMKKGDVIMAVSGNPGLATILSVDACIHDGFVGFRNLDKRIIPEFFYFVLVHQKDINNSQSIGAVFKNLNTEQIRQFQIPLPPLSIQEEIVTEIEGYQKIIDGAKAVVENYKPRIDINPEWEMVELGELCEIKAGGTPLKSNRDFWNGNIPWYSSGELNEIYTKDPEEYITKEGLKKSNATLFPKGSLLIGMYDTAAFKMSILDREATFNQAVCGVKPNTNIDMYFLMLFFIMNKEEYLRHRVGVRQRNLNKGFISEIKIPRMSLKTQRKIVAQIEQEQALVNANKQLITIFEQKIKDRIAKVWGAGKELAVYKENEEMTMAAEG